MQDKTTIDFQAKSSSYSEYKKYFRLSPFYNYSYILKLLYLVQPEIVPFDSPIPKKTHYGTKKVGGISG